MWTASTGLRSDGARHRVSARGKNPAGRDKQREPRGCANRPALRKYPVERGSRSPLRARSQPRLARGRVGQYDARRCPSGAITLQRPSVRSI